ncbi:hypothetical protein D3C75_910060 [compost metagenome]
MIGPHTGQIIGLQLKADLIFVVFRLTQALAELIQLLRGSKQGLYMMPHLVGNDIGHRKIAWRLKALLQLIIEAEVNIQFAVARTIKRPDRRACCPAG